MPHQTQILIVMVCYLVLLIFWGLYQGRKVKSSRDYAIAGRNLPGWAAALSERATGESAWVLLGLPGFAWTIIAYIGALSIVWIGTGMEERITSRIMTFLAAGFAAVAATVLIPKAEKSRRSG